MHLAAGDMVQGDFSLLVPSHSICSLSPLGYGSPADETSHMDSFASVCPPQCSETAVSAPAFIHMPGSELGSDRDF